MFHKTHGVSMGCRDTLTCALGKAEVRRVSCVSFIGFHFGMLKMKAVWSLVAAVEVIL